MATTYDDFRRLRVERRGHVLWLVIDNPPGNRIDPALHAELSRIFRRVRDDEARAVVLTATGREAFCGAGDIGRIVAGIDDHAHWNGSIAEAREIVLSMLDCDKPLVARINGHAIGFGATLALLCDITLIDEAARIGDTHVRAGLVAGDGGALIWPLLVGLPRARQYLLTGTLLTGREAAEVGLVNFAVPYDALDALTNDWAERLAMGPALAVAGTRRLLNAPLRSQVAATLDAHLGLETMSRISAEYREAILAIRDRRKPDFVNAGKREP